MSSREFAEWIAYYRVEPWGDDWQQAALVVASNLQPWSKKKINPEQFIPRAKTRKTPEEIEHQMNAWAKMHNARQRN